MTSNGFPGLRKIGLARRTASTEEAISTRPQPVESLAVREGDLIRKTTRDTIRLLGFAQLVMVFCAGAIPSPLRFLAFLPGFALVGAAIFQGAWLAVRSFEPVGHSPELSTSSQQPLSAAETHAEPRSADQVVSISRIA